MVWSKTCGQGRGDARSARPRSEAEHPNWARDQWSAHLSIRAEGRARAFSLQQPRGCMSVDDESPEAPPPLVAAH
eukprot:CAMPEP_0177791542 /NCGR_PEP_ID=MMETSP0491_2-20121128/23992_1 /TAXON_ID=63592 /ORGANISM="Tetraselmis chuii, Strain PLY429" /LENGTH=74 /DNA_ID=CAMNT_0019313787 /DNA_START=307 /DNA_END=531 /DNA_ORIENTATION=+